MAKYRAIYQTMWKDPDFQAYDPDAKLIFIYLCTNETTSESGVYPITEKTIADETGVRKDMVVKQLTNGLKNVVYDTDNRFVYVRKFRLYNSGGRPELIQKSIANEYKLSKQSFLWSLFIEDYPEFKETMLSIATPITPSSPTPPITPDNHSNITNSKGKGIEPLSNGLPTVGKGLPVNENEANKKDVNSLTTVEQPLVNGLPTVGKGLDEKKVHGEFQNIYLTEKEVQKLIERFGEKEATERIHSASESFRSHKDYPKKFTDHYATILTWARMDAKRDGGDNGRIHGQMATGTQSRPKDGSFTDEEYARQFDK